MDTARLIRLAEDGELQELLSAVSLEEIADAWWRYMMRCAAASAEGRPRPEWDGDPDSWASQIWQSEVLDQSEDIVRESLRIAAERAPADGPTDYPPLHYLGAGPIEDFVSSDEERLRWIEAEAQRSPNFRTALTNVWQYDDLTDESYARIQRAAQGD